MLEDLHRFSKEFLQRDASMRALWSDRHNCSHNVSQKAKRIRRFSDFSFRYNNRGSVRLSGCHLSKRNRGINSEKDDCCICICLCFQTFSLLVLMFLCYSPLLAEKGIVCTCYKKNSMIFSSASVSAVFENIFSI